MGHLAASGGQQGWLAGAAGSLTALPCLVHAVDHGPVDGRPRSLLGGREEVSVDAEGEAGIGVAEVVGDGPDGLAGVDEHEAQK